MLSHEQESGASLPTIKPPGIAYCYRIPAQAWRATTKGSSRFSCPFSTNSDKLFDILTRKKRIHVMSCNEAECRELLSLLVEFWERSNTNDQVQGEDYHVDFFMCALDRVCLYLVAKLAAYKWNMCLSHGTRIVSFQDADDLFQCLTELQLSDVRQSELHVPPLTKKKFLERIHNVTRLTENLDGVNNQGEIIEESNANESDVKKLQQFDFLLWLRFDIKPESIDVDALQTMCSTLPPSTFEFEIVKGRATELPLFITIALKVPTLGVYINAQDKGTGVICEKVFERVMERRTESARPLTIDVRRYVHSFDEEVNCFTISDKLLDVFNQKKLTFMSMFLNRQQATLFDKALETISQSLYIRTILVYADTRDGELWLQLISFLDRVLKVLPRLIGPVTLDIKLPLQASIEYHILSDWIGRLRKVKKYLSNVDLKSLVLLVSTKVLASQAQTGHVRLLTVDVLRKLREFLV